MEMQRPTINPHTPSAPTVQGDAKSHIQGGQTLAGSTRILGSNHEATEATIVIQIVYN